MGRVQEDRSQGAARPAHRPLLPAGQVRRRPGVGRPAPPRGRGRPGQLRDHRPDRRHRPLRAGCATSSSRPMPSPASRGPSSTSCAPSTGCRGRCGPRPGPWSRPTPRSRPRCCAPRPTPRWPPSSEMTDAEFQTTLRQISFVGVAALDEVFMVGGDRSDRTTLGDTIPDATAGPGGHVRGQGVQGDPGPGHHAARRAGEDGPLALLLRRSHPGGDRRHPRRDREPGLPDPHQGRPAAAGQAGRPTRGAGRRPAPEVAAAAKAAGRGPSVGPPPAPSGSPPRPPAESGRRTGSRVEAPGAGRTTMARSRHPARASSGTRSTRPRPRSPRTGALRRGGQPSQGAVTWPSSP